MNKAEQEAKKWASHWGRQGAKLTNSMLTREKRSRAAKKGWKKIKAGKKV